MIAEPFDPKKALQVTKMIYFAMIAGILLFAVMVFYINTSSFIFSFNTSDLLQMSMLLLCCISIPSGYLYTKNLYSKTDPSFTLREKYPVYQSGLVIRLASCEGVALYSIVNLLITNNLFSLVVFLIAFSVMALYYPSPDKIGKEINLTASEIESLYV